MSGTTVESANAGDEPLTHVDTGSRSVTYGPDGRSLCYAEYGDPAGDPVVFLHGVPGSRLLGSLYAASARRQRARVIAPDRPGFGRSTAWPDRTPTDAETWLDALLDGVGVSSVRIVGFSGGAADALALGATRPDAVERIDLVSGAAPPSVASETPVLQRTLGRFGAQAPRALGAAFRVQRRLAERGSASTVTAQYTDDPDDVPPETAELVRQDFVESCERSRNGVVTELSWITAGWGFDPSAVEQPVRCWHGTPDANVPIDDVRRLCEGLPAAELRTVDGDHLTTVLATRDRVLTPDPPRD